jgi:hypothetical protein
MKARENALRVYRKLADPEVKCMTIGETGDLYYTVRFSSEAQLAFDEWRADTEKRAKALEMQDEPLSAYYIKLERNCAATILIFHCLERAENIPDEISLPTTLAALAYIEVLTTHAERVFALGENRIFALAQVVVEKIRAGKTEASFTLREIKRKGWAGMDKPDLIQDVLTLLVDYGYLKTIDGEIGRPSTRYYVHPSIIRGESDDREME